MGFKANIFQRLGLIAFLSLGILVVGITESALAQDDTQGQMSVAERALAQDDTQGQMSVAERDDAGKAIRFDFNFTSRDLKALIEFISKETDLTVIATENDIKDKKFALTNLKNVTIDEVLEEVKTVLAQYELTMIRANNTLLFTTFTKAVRMKVPVKRITADPDQVAPTDEIQTYIIELNSAIASELVDGIKPLLSSSANIFADATSNALIITDVSSNVRRIATILQVADEAPERPLKVMIVQLENAPALDIARALNDVFRQDGEGDKTVKRLGTVDDPEEMRKMMEEAREKGLGIDLLQGRIQVSADESSNSLIIKASEINIVALQELISQLDTTPSLQTEIRIFRLQYATAEDVAQTLEEVITGQSAGRRPGGRGRKSSWERREWDRRRQDLRRRRQGQDYQGILGMVNVASNDRLNAVVISSDPRNFPIIEKIISELDQADPQEEIRIYFLKFGDAQNLSANLQDLFEGGTTGRDRDRNWWDQERREGTDGGFGVQGPVHLVPDTRLNALMVSTAAQNFDTIESLLKRLDVNMPDQEWGTRIYKLKYADAENVADIINNVYQGESNNSRRFFFVPSRSRNQNQGSLAGNVTAEPYPTLNSIIVSTATQRNFELVSQFIEQIDTPTPESQKEVTKPIRLEYANADEIQQVLSQVWEDSEGGGFSFGRFFARGGRMEQKDINSLRGKVTVFADPGTNSLVVTTLQRYLFDVEALIRKLDFVRGQVWIDIQILEVTLDDETIMGLELTAQENKLFGKDLRPGNPLVGTAETKFFTQDDLVSGVTYSVATKEYMALLHTLMRQNKVRTLSTPSLLTRDNQPATWQSGRRIPYLQGVDDRGVITAGENQVSQPVFNQFSQPLYNYDFIDPPVGISVSLTPHIAKSQEGPEGKRTIGLEIESIQASSFIEFTDFNAPITEINEISAYIDVEDGQQIVVGGIIRSSQQEIESKVPILGDIPFIGGLFKKTATETKNAEIVMIITPHIIDIRNPEDRVKLGVQAEKWRNNGNGIKEQNNKENAEKKK